MNAVKMGKYGIAGQLRISGKTMEIKHVAKILINQW